MLLIKIKKFYRILFPKQASLNESFETKLDLNKSILTFEKNDIGYTLKLKDGSEIMIRDKKSSDFDVFEQVYTTGEYDIVLNMLRLNHQSNSSKNIIDAGANIGLTSIYFANNLENVQLFSIEPSKESIEVFEKNRMLMKSPECITIYNNALSEKPGAKFKIGNDFRDRRDWALFTIEDPRGEIEGVTINEIVIDNNLTSIAFLKIDIEGAERLIFKAGSDFSYLEITEIIAIEIHDEFQCREKIYELFKSHGFYLFEVGETTICINKRNCQVSQ